MAHRLHPSIPRAMCPRCGARMRLATIEPCCGAIMRTFDCLCGVRYEHSAENIGDHLRASLARAA
jgi:hypothetical protein